MKVIKRSGAEVPFEEKKILSAILSANKSVSPEQRIGRDAAAAIADIVTVRCRALGRSPSVEEIQDFVEDGLIEADYPYLMRAYTNYRVKHSMLRKQNTTDEKILSLINYSSEEVKQENANKNPVINSTQRDYMAGLASRDLTRRKLLPEDVVEAHDEGIIHFHDSDYFASRETNCCLVNLDDMLQNGTVISGTLIEKPHSFSTACNIATQIIAQVASSQYGGQTITLSHLAPFVDVSRQKIRRELREELASSGVSLPDVEVEKIVEQRLKKEINRGVQIIQYQIITLMTTNGQAPFVTVFMYLDEVPAGQLREDLAMVIEEVLRQRIEGVKNPKGVWITPAFPKLIYVLDEDNITEDSKYWYLTELAAECTAKRMVPDYISAKVMKKLKGDIYPCMGCRSFLTPDDGSLKNAGESQNYLSGQHQYYGRFNQGVVTINLVDAACSSEGNEEKFWQLMDERTELCKKALMCRHNRLLDTPSDVAPILWQYGALARLKPGEKINKLLFNNYSTISLGYAGLCECVRFMTCKSNTEPEGMKFGMQVMQFLNDKCAKWRAETNISFSLYGTPMESTTYKFAKCLQRRFGIIEGVTDKNYITNSYHVHVTENIDAFSKLSIESKFQELSPGGAISYVEVPDMQGNIPAVLDIIKHIYNTILYAELNTKCDYCQVCGYDGEIKIVEDDDGKLVWECPNCGNRDQSKMNVVRRVCGYLGSNYFNQGRTAEIMDRVLHVGVPMLPEGCLKGGPH